MVHPSELLRTDSDTGREFSAPANILDENLIDCGLSGLPCLNNCLNLERFAKLKLFVIFLSAVGFLHGFTLYYFRGTAKIWSQHYNITQENIEWLIYTNEFFVGIIALFVAHVGNKIHRIAWIGALTIFHSINCLVLIIPEVYKKNNATLLTLDDFNLCREEGESDNFEKEVNYIALGVLVIFQLFYAMATVSFSSHGLTYLDDNSHKKNSPALLGIVLGVREIGKQVGLYSSGFPVFFGRELIFLSPVWISAAIITFTSGVMISMFPKYLPSILLQPVSASILDLAMGLPTRETRVKKPGSFFVTLWRLLKNEVLILNILCTVFIQSAIINFGILENIANQSHFQISSRNYSYYTQFVIDLLKQPLIAISVVASGMVVSKAKPKIRSLIIYNLVIFVLVLLFYSSTAFLNCDENIRIEHQNYYYKSACNRNCAECPPQFEPICVNNSTYFSPCFAGCTKSNSNGDDSVYHNCTCGERDTYSWKYTPKMFQGVEGSCTGKNCYVYWALSQANNVITSALLASTFVTNLLINMRSIPETDKAAALGLESTLLGLIPYLPVKSLYGAVVDSFCQVRQDGVCYYYSSAVGLFVSSSTILLMVISISLGLILLFRFNHDIDGQVENEENPGEEMVEMSRSNQQLPESRALMSGDEIDSGGDESRRLRADNVLSSNSGISWESLMELENVGDDHDSVASMDPHRPVRR